MTFFVKVLCIFIAFACDNKEKILKKVVGYIFALILTLSVGFTCVGCGDNLRDATIRVKFDSPLITADNDLVGCIDFTEENDSAEFTVLYDRIQDKGSKMDVESFYHDAERDLDVYWHTSYAWSSFIEMELSFIPEEGEDAKKKNWNGPILERGKYIFRYEINKHAKEDYKVKPFTAHLYITVI